MRDSFRYFAERNKSCTRRKEMLKRNKKPFEHVIENWKICQKVRLKNLITNRKISIQ